MSIKEKLIERFSRLPNDFTFDELVRLLAILGYKQNNKGTTSGSKVVFVNVEDDILLHKPHPGNTVHKCYLKVIKNKLKAKGLI